MELSKSNEPPLCYHRRVAGRTVLKTYRSKIPIAGGSVAALGCFIVGLSVLDPESHAGASGVFVAVLCLGASAVLGAALITNRLIVTTEGIISWHTFRKRVIPWLSVRSFQVGGPRGLLPWPGLVVKSDSGFVRIDSIVGTKSFVQGVASELLAFQRDNISPSDGRRQSHGT